MDLQKIVEQTIEKAAENAVEQTIIRKWGYKDSEDIAKVVKEAAIELIKTDPEIKEKLKAAIISWIKKEAATA